MPYIDCVIGIDPSTAKLAATTTGPYTGMQMHLLELPRDHAVACAMAFNWIHKLGDRLRALNSDGGHPKVFIFLEKPIVWHGGRSTIPLAQVNGALQAGALWQRSHVSEIILVNNQRWKLEVCGKGGLSKPEIAKAMQEVWPHAWLRAHRIKRSKRGHSLGVILDQDLLESAAINKYGRRVLRYRRRMERTRG